MNRLNLWTEIQPSLCSIPAPDKFRDQLFKKLGVHSRLDASKWLTDRFCGWLLVVLVDWEWVGELVGGMV